MNVSAKIYSAAAAEADDNMRLADVGGNQNSVDALINVRA
jgi:hypothetical protein